MEIAHAQRDHMTRDFHNEIDSLRQRDSGLKGVMPKSDPTATAHNHGLARTAMKRFRTVNTLRTHVATCFAACVSDSNTGYSCDCPLEDPDVLLTTGSRWSGRNCTEPAQYCEWNTNPCKHDGTCVSDGQTNFHCECSGTWTGPTCEGCADGLRGTGCHEVIPYCKRYDNPCPDNSECSSRRGGHGWTAQCSPYTAFDLTTAKLLGLAAQYRCN
jgi:hypothetical protein